MILGLKLIACPYCKGKKTIKGTKGSIIKCRACNGTGKIWK